MMYYLPENANPLDGVSCPKPWQERSAQEFSTDDREEPLARSSTPGFASLQDGRETGQSQGKETSRSMSALVGAAAVPAGRRRAERGARRAASPDPLSHI